MKRNPLKSMTLNERIRLNWIEELKAAGVEQGPHGELLTDMSYQDLKFFLTVSKEKNGTGIDLEAKANAFF